MMVVLVLGTPGSGKSKLAEDLTLELAEGDKKYYIATMIPYGEDGEERVKRHRNLRRGKGFVTVEQPVEIDALTETLPDIADSSCLLECVSNLVGNEMHDNKNLSMSYAELLKKIAGEIECLAKSTKNLVIVANDFPEDGDGYDEETREYVRLANQVNIYLRNIANKVYEIK